MDPSQDNPISWRTPMKSLPGKICDGSRSICECHRCKRAAWNALNTRKPFVFDRSLPEIYVSLFFVVFFKTPPVLETNPLWRHKGHWLLSKVFPLTPVKLKAKRVVFFGDRESFWIIDWAMAAAAKWFQHGTFKLSEGLRGQKTSTICADWWPTRCTWSKWEQLKEWLLFCGISCDAFDTFMIVNFFLFFLFNFATLSRGMTLNFLRLQLFFFFLF